MDARRAPYRSASAPPAGPMGLSEGGVLDTVQRAFAANRVLPYPAGRVIELGSRARDFRMQRNPPLLQMTSFDLSGTSRSERDRRFEASSLQRGVSLCSEFQGCGRKGPRLRGALRMHGHERRDVTAGGEGDSIPRPPQRLFDTARFDPGSCRPAHRLPGRWSTPRNLTAG